MNVQRLIEKYKELYENVFDSGAKLACQSFLKDLEQLDEQKPVKVPQCVADWIENCKRGLSLRQAISQVHVSNEVDDWLMEVDADGAFVNQETFARAWLDGYEVEEEKRYLVKLKSSSEEIDYLVDTKTNGFRFYSNIYTKNRAHTRKELEEAGFEWVFDCEGVEIEEVK